MNLAKKELIIIALLLNLGVLTFIVSFATSGKKESLAPATNVVYEKKEQPDLLPGILPPEIPVQRSSSASKESKTASFDEIDQLLEEYIPLDESIGEKMNKEIQTKPETPLKKTQSTTPQKNIPPLKPVPSKVNSSIKPSQINAEKKKSVKTVEKATLKEEEKFYVVQSGDNPWKIAKKFHISFEKLLQLNNLNEKRARVLKVGERLKIREDS